MEKVANTLSFYRLVPDVTGLSHFSAITLDVQLREFAPPALPFSVSELQPASRHGFLHLPTGWSGDLHPSPMRMWIAVLNGEMEFEAGDGECRRLVPGSALLLEDTTGSGHCSRVIGARPATLLAVHV